jgi:hypothetical protein
MTTYSFGDIVLIGFPHTDRIEKTSATCPCFDRLDYQCLSQHFVPAAIADRQGLRSSKYLFQDLTGNLLHWF